MKSDQDRPRVGAMRDLKGLLPDFLQRIADDPELSLIFLKELWPQVVGDAVARRARPAALRGRNLTCHVFAQSWRDELSSMRPMLIGAINQFWGCRLVDRIRFVVHLEQSE